jgi:peptidoglycan-N-acetylglucosamine deacetylase
MLRLVLLLIGGVVALAHTAPFPFLLEAFHPGQSIWRVKHIKGTPPAVYLTFDDGPNPDWTPALLDALRDEGARATFFLIDRHITDETAPIVRRIAAEGHAIALHTGSRRPMSMDAEALAAEVRRGADRIFSLTGREPCRLFRPHAGWRSGTMYDGLKRAGFQLAGWSWGMWDWDWWRDVDARRLSARLARKASAGDIIVIHDGHHKNARADRRYAAGTVRLLVPALKQRAFTFAPLC